ncbi:hypothetical protein SR39_29675 [Methylobacterium radiotolerans]|jgi:hypothetical protein|nr:hypothetical protein SR39_29675 [Methylobacterium radiotolerans]
MTHADLDKRAELTIWPRPPAPTKQAMEFRTLREALTAAAPAHSEAQPWIVTEDGDILSPGWIRANVKLACRQ